VGCPGSPSRARQKKEQLTPSAPSNAKRTKGALRAPASHLALLEINARSALVLLASLVRLVLKIGGAAWFDLAGNTRQPRAKEIPDSRCAASGMTP
jgi:hypothetical protein